MLNLRLHIYNNKICNSSLVQGFLSQPTPSEGRFPPSFVMSFCRQIPGCSLSPTGAGSSTASGVRQPLISAARDGEGASGVSISLRSTRAALGAARAREGTGGSAPPQPQPGSTQSQREAGKAAGVSHSHPQERRAGGWRCQEEQEIIMCFL